MPDVSQLALQDPAACAKLNAETFTSWGWDPPSLLDTTDWSSWFVAIKKREMPLPVDHAVESAASAWPFAKHLYATLQSDDLCNLFSNAYVAGILTQSAAGQIHSFVESFPIAGKKQYGIVIRRYGRWCRFNNLPSSLLTPMRALRFMDAEGTRPVMRTANKKTERVYDDVLRIVGPQSNSMALNALVYLYGIQKLIFPQLESPRTSTVTNKTSVLDLISTAKRTSHTHDRQDTHNLDVHDPEIHPKIGTHYLYLPQGSRPLQGWAQWNVMYSTCSRGDWTRKIDLSDLFFREVSGHGPSTMKCISVVKDNYKNQTLDKSVVVGFTRAARVIACPVSSLAYLLYFDLDMKTLNNKIDFTKYSMWHNLKLFHTKSRTASMSDGAQRRQLKSVMKSAGVGGLYHVTHLAKKLSLVSLELGGCPENQALRLACYSSNISNQSYKNSLLPLEALRILAGFPEKGDYFIPRQFVEVPCDLKKQIFAFAESVIASITPKTPGYKSIMGLMTLLIALRPIILQDSLILKEKFPNLAIWSSLVFTSESYTTWYRFALAKLNELKRGHIPNSAKPAAVYEMLSQMSMHNSTGDIVVPIKVTTPVSQSPELVECKESTAVISKACIDRYMTLGQLDTIGMVMEDWKLSEQRALNPIPQMFPKGYPTQRTRKRRIVKEVTRIMREKSLDVQGAISAVERERIELGMSTYQYSENVLKKQKKKKK